MPKISLIIPTLRLNGMLEKCIESMDGEYDELIVIDDKWNNLAKKINKGLGMATGDFLLVANDDITLDRGHLEDLCVKDKVLSPYVNNSRMKDFHAHLFALPRDVYKKVGGYCEDYDGFYYDDSDYWMRLISNGYIPELNFEVNINHPKPGSTLGTFTGNNEREQNNRRLFISKWGNDALAIVGV